MSLFKSSKSFLGVDIGTASLKIVELSQSGNKKKLENYGEMAASAFFDKPFRTLDKNSLLLSDTEVARAITGILKEAKIKTKKAIFSIPDFSTFFTYFELPFMTKEELPQAINFEAKQHVPLPLNEVTLDWQIIDQQISERNKTKLKILLVAVPNEIIYQYQNIAKMTQLQVSSLEAEVFGLTRSLVKDEEKAVVCIVDFGAQSTTINIIDKKTLKRSHSCDISGNQLTQIIMKSLGVDFNEAESSKQKYGLLPSEKNIRDIMLPFIDLAIVDVESISQDFYLSEGKEVQKIILAGGTALIPGFKEYFSENLKKEVEIADPFYNIFYPSVLEKKIKKMGPSYAIAVGVALRGLEL